MTDCQTTNIEKKTKFPTDRLIAAAILLVIVGVVVVLRLAEQGYIQLQYFFGVCGFKQRFGLPCPGCGWTHAAQAFATGDVIRAFQIQPAATVFCFVIILTAVLALHTLLFGINSHLQRLLIWPRFWKYVIICFCVVIFLGWIVTLAKALSDTGGS